jgi:hypothetical protein
MIYVKNFFSEETPTPKGSGSPSIGVKDMAPVDTRSRKKENIRRERQTDS